MLKRPILTLIIFIILHSLAYASVWDGKKPWKIEDLDNYAQWVKDSVKNDIFSNQDSPYYGVATDCADLIYALMAIYSFENNLYFQIRINSEGQTIDNLTTSFDHIENEQKKLVSFLNFVGRSAGTYSLARYNSLPISIENIKEADIYITQFLSDNKPTQHTYLIKGLIPTGHFELYSSTTPQMVRPLNIRRGFPQHEIEDAPWGFKRAMPYYLVKEITNNKEAYKELFNDSQYQLLYKNRGRFFNEVSHILQKEEDSLNNNINHQLFNLCEMLKARKFEVGLAREKIEGKNQCLSRSQYDLYSTPTRDNNLKVAFNRLLVGYKKMTKDQNLLEQIDPELQEILNYFIQKNDSYETRSKITTFCSIEIDNKKYNLYDFFIRQYKSLISSNPNDPYLTRWGLDNQKSKCK